MTEAEWLACADSEPMLEFLRGKARDRKLRLFACHCVREYQRIMRRGANVEGLTRGVELTERYVDGLATREEWWEGTRERFHFGPWKSEAALSEALAGVWTAGGVAGWDQVSHYSDEQESAERQFLTQFVRDIFGNPFRPAAAAAAWLTSDVVRLAEGIYQNRAFDGLPILGDALEEAGCDGGDVLVHCRGPDPHVRGCWVVDLVLGKG